jgi:hypothetical protein
MAQYPAGSGLPAGVKSAPERLIAVYASRAIAIVPNVKLFVNGRTTRLATSKDREGFNIG